jgi:hypothetical protein
MRKKGFLEKLGLVESNNDNFEATQAAWNELKNQFNEEQDIQPQVKVEIDESSLEGIITINEIYEQSNLNDLSKSIFRVKSFSEALPDTLTTEAKRQSVLGILAASDLNVEELKEDAYLRIEAINSVMEQFSNSTDNIIEDGNEEIKRLQEQIESIKEKINSRQLLQENQMKLVNDEINKIKNIVEFLG